MQKEAQELIEFVQTLSIKDAKEVRSQLFLIPFDTEIGFNAQNLIKGVRRMVNTHIANQIKEHATG